MDFHHGFFLGSLLCLFLGFSGLQVGLSQGLLLGFPGIEGNPSWFWGVLLVVHGSLLSQCSLIKANRLVWGRVKKSLSFLTDLNFSTQSLFCFDCTVFGIFRNFSLFRSRNLSLKNHSIAQKELTLDSEVQF